jgi:Lysylphosphatidylglycerol synthase TM region
MGSSGAAYSVVGRVGAGGRKVLVHAAFAAMGLLAIGLLVRGVGAAALGSVLRTSARWLPLLFAVDALRVVAEAAATWSLAERVRRRVPLAELARVHLVGYAVAAVVPAGRAAGEAVKAAMLSRFVGAAEAAAVAAANQATSLLGGILGGFACLVAALAMTGASPLSGAVGGFVAVTVAGFAGVQMACRGKALTGAILRRFTGRESASQAFHEALGRIPIVPRGATAAHAVNRLVVVVELGILLAVLGGRHGPGEALLAQGVNLVAGTVGDVVPGQLGATDGAFALAAPTLGLRLADGVAIAVMLHAVQAMWAVIGWVVPLVWKAPARAVGDAAEDPRLPPHEPA